MRSIAALPAALAALASIASAPSFGPSDRTRSRRRELSAAWRWYEPRPLVLPKGQGPRPADTYRAARRNAGRNHFAKAAKARRAASHGGARALPPAVVS